jgi:V8-like Glu-specific endopeptidase
MSFVRPALSVALLGLLGTVGCAEETEEAAQSDDAITGPQYAASSYPEAVLIQVNNAGGDFCSGVIVAPKVVLTAAHCVVFNPKGSGSRGTWTVSAPFASGGAQTRTASRGEPMEAAFASLTYDTYTSTTTLHDLAAIYVDTPFTGIAFPVLSRTPIVAAT